MSAHLISSFVGVYVEKWVLTMQPSRWAGTLEIDRSRPELQHRSTASGSRWSALRTSPPRLLNSPGQTAGERHPGNTNNCSHRKILSLNVIFYVDPVQLAYRSRLVSEIYLQLAHCPDDGHDGLDGVAVHDHFVLLALLFWVAIFMNDPDTDTKSKQDFRARVNIWQCQQCGLNKCGANYTFGKFNACTVINAGIWASLSIQHG